VTQTISEPSAVRNFFNFIMGIMGISKGHPGALAGWPSDELPVFSGSVHCLMIRPHTIERPVMFWRPTLSVAGLRFLQSEVPVSCSSASRSQVRTI
jgi:hypothetical protein